MATWAAKRPGPASAGYSPFTPAGLGRPCFLKGEVMAADLTAQRDALNSLSLAYEAAYADFTSPLTRIGFGNPPGSPSECVWPQKGITETEIDSRLFAAQHFLRERDSVLRGVISDISTAQVGLTASGFDEARARSFIIPDILENFRGALLGAPGASVEGILKTVAAEIAGQ